MNYLRLLILALFGLLVVADCDATECVSVDSTEVVPFSGQWRDDAGDTMTIRPGFFSLLRAEERAKGDVPWVHHLVRKEDQNDAGMESWDCRTLDRKSIEQLVKDIEEAADRAIVPRPAKVQAEIDKTRALLSQPIYPVIDVAQYETRVVYLLLDKNDLLAIDFEMAGFETTRFVRVEPDKLDHLPR